MNPIGDSSTQLQIEFEERLCVMAKQQQEAVALVFATQRQQVNQENKLFRHLSTTFLMEASRWLKHRLQGKRGADVSTNGKQLLQPVFNQDSVVIVDAEYRVIEDNSKTARTTTCQEVTVWVS